MEAFPKSHIEETKHFCRVEAEKPGLENTALYKQYSVPSNHHLSLTAARRVATAVLYASERHQNWRGITINLSLLDAPQAAEQTMRAILDHIRHWQDRHGCPAYWVWVREQGGRLGDHAHILAAAPTGAGRSLSDHLRRWLRGPSIRGDLPPGTLHSRPTSALGWLAYVVKTVTPADATKVRQEFCLRVTHEKPGGQVIGQRVGIARGLGPKARQVAATQTQHERIAE